MAQIVEKQTVDDYYYYYTALIFIWSVDLRACG